MRTTALLVLTTITACASDTSDASPTGAQCKFATETYLASYSTTSGDCGNLPDEVTAPGAKSAGDWQCSPKITYTPHAGGDDCDVHVENYCTRSSDSASRFVSYDLKPDNLFPWAAEGYTGTLSVTVTAGQTKCSGSYSVKLKQLSGDANDAVPQTGDLCAVNNGGCDTVPMARCTNQPGAVVSCACPAGYTGDGVGDDGCKINSTGTSGGYSYDSTTVLDGRTGLIWQRVVPAVYAGCASGSSCTGLEAMSYCQQLALAGVTGWRAPTKDELVALIDMSFVQGIDPTAFPTTEPESTFWSSTPAPAPYDGWFWYVAFANHYVNFAKIGQQVRCVR